MLLRKDVIAIFNSAAWDVFSFLLVNQFWFGLIHARIICQRTDVLLFWSGYTRFIYTCMVCSYKHKTMHNSVMAGLRTIHVPEVPNRTFIYIGHLSFFQRSFANWLDDL